MKRIYSFCLIVVLATLLLSCVFLLGLMGIEMTLMTKLFIIFVGTVIGFQSVPAVLSFSGMAREAFAGRDAIVDKSTR